MRLVYSKFETHNAKTKLQTPKRNVLLQQSPVSPAELIMTSDIFGDVYWPKYVN